MLRFAKKQQTQFLLSLVWNDRGQYNYILNIKMMPKKKEITSSTVEELYHLPYMIHFSCTRSVYKINIILYIFQWKRQRTIHCTSVMTNALFIIAKEREKRSGNQEWTIHRHRKNWAQKSQNEDQQNKKLNAEN